MQAHRVRVLLMGGQACVLYCGAEFTRGTDFAILADSANLNRLRKGLVDLPATVIAVPPFELKFLAGPRHPLWCEYSEAAGIRVDIMSKMRGVDPFPKLWRRRTAIVVPDGTRVDLLSLSDLLQAKNPTRQ